MTHNCRVDEPMPAMSYDLLTRLEARGKVLVVRVEPFYFVFADIGGEVELTCYQRAGEDLWREFSQEDAGWPSEGYKGGWSASSNRAVGYLWHLGRSRHPVITVRYKDVLHEISTDEDGHWAFIQETSLDDYDEPFTILT